MSACKVTSSQIAKRLQYRAYTGPVVTGIAALKNFAYVSSDVVPVGKYWGLVAASMFINGIGSAIANQGASLYAVTPSAALPGNSATYAQQKIFLSYKDGISDKANEGNGVPLDPSLGFRIDEFNATDVGSSSLNTPTEVLIYGRSRKPFILPSGWALVGHNGQFNGSGFIGVQLTLKIFFVEMAENQDLDSWF